MRVLVLEVTTIHRLICFLSEYFSFFSFFSIPSDIKTHKIDFHYCHRVFLVLSKAERKKNSAQVYSSLSLFFLFLIQCFGVFASLKCAALMKRKAVRLANAKKYIYFFPLLLLFMCRTESAFTAKNKQRKERRRVVKTRTLHWKQNKKALLQKIIWSNCRFLHTNAHTYSKKRKRMNRMTSIGKFFSVLLVCVVARNRKITWW